MRIRNATENDLDDVLEIFNHEIISDVTAWDTEPIEGLARQQWFEAQVFRLLRNHNAKHLHLLRAQGRRNRVKS